MSAFPDWPKYAVHQRRLQTGCIPTCYEMLLRAAGVRGIDYESFQDDFDLDRQGGVPRNHFLSVSDAIKEKYPFVEFAYESFAKGDGDKKLARVLDFITRRQPVIVSLANAAFGGRGWHIMVVIDVTVDHLILLEYVDRDGVARTRRVSKEQFAHIHDVFPGGDEISYLSRPGVYHLDSQIASIRNVIREEEMHDL